MREIVSESRIERIARITWIACEMEKNPVVMSCYAPTWSYFSFASFLSESGFSGLEDFQDSWMSCLYCASAFIRQSGDWFL